MTKFTIELESTIRVPLGDTGKVTELRLSEMPAETVRFAAINGLISALNNISRGKDEQGRENSDDVWAAARDKRTAPWYQGTWGSTSRESATGPLKEAYIEETISRTHQSRADVEKDMARLVRDAYGDKSKATWGTFLDALSAAIAKANGMEDGEVRQRLEAKYTRLAGEAAAKRKAAGAKLDVSSISLD